MKNNSKPDKFNTSPLAGEVDTKCRVRGIIKQIGVHSASSFNVTCLPLPVRSGDKYNVSSGVQCGRSMIEMLGVLAIIAVLSVGGIAGYSKAMKEWKSNIQRSMITELLHAMIEIKPKLGQNLTEFQNITNVVDSLGYMPEGVTYKNNSIYDKTGNQIEIHKYNGTQKDYVMEIYFKTEENSHLSLNSEELCHNIVLASQSVAKEIMQINFWQNNESEKFAPILFTHNNLAQATLADIQNRCKILSKYKGAAHFTIGLIP